MSTKICYSNRCEVAHATGQMTALV